MNQYVLMAFFFFFPHFLGKKGKQFVKGFEVQKIRVSLVQRSSLGQFKY